MVTILSIGYCGALLYEGYEDYGHYRHYGDFRDYYPCGLWVTAHKLDTPPADEYVELEGDPYIESAIATGNLTWVNEEDSPFVAKTSGGINYIKWLPDGNYYYIDGLYLDGFPDNPWKILGPQRVAMSVFAGLAVAWVSFIFVWRKTRHTS